MTIRRQRFRPRGVVTDRPAIDVPANRWTFSEGMTLSDGVPQRRPGMGAEYEPPTGRLNDPTHVIPFRIRPQPERPSWIYCSRVAMYLNDGLTETVITPADYANSTDLNRWSSDLLNRVPVLATTDNADNPWYYPEGGPLMLPLPGWFPSGRVLGALRAWQNFLLCLGFDDGTDFLPDVVKWSDAAPAGTVPATWIPAIGNQAGDAALSDTPGELIDGAPLGRNFLAYKDHSAYIGQLTGDQFVQTWRLRFAQLGAIARNCVVNLGQSHVVFSDGDVVLTDGVNVESLLRPQQRRFLFSNLETVTDDAVQRAFAAWEPDLQQIWIFFPRIGQAEVRSCLIIDRAGGSVHFQEFPFEFTHAKNGLVLGTPPPSTTWENATTPWNEFNGTWRPSASANSTNDRLLLASESQQALYSQGTRPAIEGPETDSFAIAGKVAIETRDFGNPFVTKRCLRVWPQVDGISDTDQIRIRIGTQQRATDPIAWGAFATFEPARDTDGVEIEAEGRFLSFWFETQTLNKQWRIPGFDVDYVERGRY